VSLVSGAIGGNITGAALKDQSLGTLGNSVAGILGGGLGAAILGALGASTGTGGLDIASLVGSIASGGGSGGIVMLIVTVIKSAIAKV
jgi:hypothetical protein